MQAISNSSMQAINKPEETSRFTWKTGVATVMLWTSVLFLYPGVTGELMHYRVEYNIDWLGRTLMIKEDTRTLWGSNPQGSIIGALVEHKIFWAAYLLLFFGVAIPLVKLVSFHAWILAKPGSALDRFATTWVHRCGSIAKWAAVDAVCEAMFIGMMMRIESVQADHRMAYVSFIIYCVLSATSFLMIAPEEKQVSTGPFQQALGRGIRKMPLIVVASAFIFMLSLHGAVTNPIMRAVIPESVIRDAAREEIKKASIKESRATQAVENHLINEIAQKVRVDEEITVLECVTRLLESGIPCSVLPSLVLFTCVLLVPMLDIIVSTIGVCFESTTKVVMRARYIFQHFAMLDVCFVGFILAVLTSKCEPAIKAALLPDFVYMLGACFVWYVHSLLCRLALEAAPTEQPKPVADAEKDLLAQEA